MKKIATAVIAVGFVLGRIPYASSAATPAVRPPGVIDLCALLKAGTPETVGVKFRPTGQTSCDGLVVSGEQSHNTLVFPAIDAASLLGRTVRLRLHARSNELSSASSLGAWVRTDVYGGSLRQAGSRPLPIGAAGVDFTASVLVDAATSKLRIGLVLDGKGPLLIENLALEAGEPLPLLVENDSSEALSRPVLDQLKGYGKALAAIRYFGMQGGPTVDWNAAARSGVQVLSTAMSAQAYVATLAELLGPHAPGARWSNSAAPLRAQPAAVPAAAAYLTRNVYRGYGSRHIFFRTTTEYLDLADQPAAIDEELLPQVHLQFAPIGYADAARHMLNGVTELPTADTAAEYSGADRATRLANVLQLWGALRHFYPYADVVDIDWDDMLEQGLSLAAVSPGPGQMTLVLDHMLTALHDGHAWVSGPDLPAAYVPALHLALVDGGAYVTMPPQRTDRLCQPSALPPGSEVLTVDGESIAMRLAAVRFYRRVATDTMQRGVDADWLLAGARATPAVLRYRTPSGQLVSKSLPRAWQTFEVVCEAPHRAVEMLAPGVWYVDLNQASDNELQVHEQAFMTAKALIFDARKYIRTDFRYLGHFSATTLLGPRTDIPLIRLPDGVGWQWDRMQMHIAPLAPRIATRAIYLVGGQTMSRAETYLQFVKYYGLGTIIGEPTAGTSGDVSSIALPGGYQAFWTGVRFQTQDGARFHGVGIVPDVTLIPTLAQRLQGGDTLLTAALQVIGAPDQPQ